MFLMNHSTTWATTLRSAKPCSIAQDSVLLQCLEIFHWEISKHVCLSTECGTKTPTRLSGGFWGLNSLTMSYFHTGTRTIIGAKSFHCPVRDGKEWYQLAMVIRHNLLSSWPRQDNEFIEFGIRFFVFRHFWMRQLGITALIFWASFEAGSKL